jgi:hypothetical protein
MTEHNGIATPSFHIHRLMRTIRHAIDDCHPSPARAFFDDPHSLLDIGSMAEEVALGCKGDKAGPPVDDRWQLCGIEVQAEGVVGIDRGGQPVSDG